MSLLSLNKSDLWFTSDGDFLIDGAGDLRDTLDSGDRYEGIKQSIMHRLISEAGALRLHPSISADLGSLIGRVVDKRLLESIQFSIHRALTSDNALSRSEYNIRTVDLVAGNVAILVFINLPGQEHPIVSMAWNIHSGEVTRAL